MANTQSTHRFHRQFTAAQDYEADWRKTCQTSFEYADGSQFTEEEEDVLDSRGQQASVLNMIRPTIDLIIAMQAERRIDFQIIGREASDDALAHLLTELENQVLEQSDYAYYETQGFRQGIIGGRAFFEVAVDKDGEGRNQIVVHNHPWEELYLDPYHRKPDASDAKHMFRQIWLDVDEVKRIYPDKAEEVTGLMSITYDSDYQGQEYEAQSKAADRGSKGRYWDAAAQRVGLVECYYKEEGKLKHCIFAGHVFLKGSEHGKNESPHPAKMNDYPWVPYYAFRDHKGLPKGLVEYLRPLQDMLNKENSKYLWSISANRLFYEEGAIDDPDELRSELNRPDGVIRLAEGKMDRYRLEDNLRESQHLLQHMGLLITMLQRISGVNDATMGIGGTNERSAMQQQGRVIQGAQMQTSIIENLYFTKKRISKTVLRFIGAYYTDERVVRQTQPNGTSEYYKLNSSEEGALPINIDETLRYDVELKPAQPFTTTRQLTMTTFAEVAKTGVIPPEIVGEIMVELSDLPNKRDILYRMQKMFSAQAGAAAEAQAAEIEQQSPSGAEVLPEPSITGAIPAG